ncbi:MAG: ribosome small subunit-dependent GTPase A [Lachnospiraceae bacterium]|nr:ribosome small subunit-dependent GTPase A [Lachnospiraceae bacterium]
MKGKIIKGIAGFYYVNVEGSGVYECKAKGIFRNRQMKPLPGDDVLIDVLDETEKTGNITDICDRRTELIRPAVANADQAMIVFAAKEPEPNLNLLDRFLVLMQEQAVDTIICFNKKDQLPPEKMEALTAIYRDSGCTVLAVSAQNGEGKEELKKLLEGKTTVLAGPSGVGKSTIINLLYPEAEMQTGSISEKIKRGKHTTRHSELFYVSEGTYLFDTPGFGSLYLGEMEKEELKEYYPEFTERAEQCRFIGCLHDREPDCAVKEAVENGEISAQRYENYQLLLRELGNRKKY